MQAAARGTFVVRQRSTAMHQLPAGPAICWQSPRSRRAVEFEHRGSQGRSMNCTSTRPRLRVGHQSLIRHSSKAPSAAPCANDYEALILAIVIGEILQIVV